MRLRWALVALALSPGECAGPTVTGASPRMLAVEGGTTVVLTGSGFNASATPEGAVCRVDPAPGGTTQLINATTALFPVLSMAADNLVCSGAPAVAAPGPGLLRVSLDGGRTWLNHSVRVRYYEQVQVALDRRPYINEASGQLLLRSNIVALGGTLTVTATLPCMGADAVWTWETAGNTDATLLLPFDALGPNTAAIHNDLIVNVSWSGGSVLKRRRFHRVPPPDAKSGVKPVQVDHARAGLLVDGEPWIGTGWSVRMLTARVRASARARRRSSRDPVADPPVASLALALPRPPGRTGTSPRPRTHRGATRLRSWPKSSGTTSRRKASTKARSTGSRRATQWSRWRSWTPAMRSASKSCTIWVQATCASTTAGRSTGRSSWRT